jgi:hypothetical protein
MGRGGGGEGSVSFLFKTRVPNIFRYDKDLASHARIKLKLSAEKHLHQSDKWPVLFYSFNQNGNGRHTAAELPNI